MFFSFVQSYLIQTDHYLPSFESLFLSWALTRFSSTSSGVLAYMVSAQIYLVCTVSFVYGLVLCALTAMLQSLLKPSLCLADNIE